MDVSAIGPGVVPARFSTADYSAKVAEVNNEARLQAPAARASESSAAANVVTSKTYSPAVYAQAAHFQVLAQASAFAAMQGVQPPQGAAAKLAEPAVTKIDSVSGSSVDTVG